ncbi:MAG: nuclear transport factor 2 family protein [Desulfosarcinaceae bacterium]|nr:nuclear transport factor 2 family protein [Desulfosarcinaceae bacterium]
MTARYIAAMTVLLLLTACSGLHQQQSGMNRFSPREQIIEVVNKLFVYTDEQDWSGLIAEVFDSEVVIDMVSVGAKSVETRSSEEITALWEAGFKGLDAVHHQAGNYIVAIDGDAAKVKAYAIASHFKAAATAGNVREFIGSYDLGLIRRADGWRINGFKYSLKYLDGNVELK